MRGKYFQWRAHLISSPDGNYSPYLSDVTVVFESDISPQVPLHFEVLDSGDRYITLRWRPNVDHDFHAYKIYYGVKSGEYEGVLTHISGKEINNDFLSEDGYVEIRISNDVIKENLVRHTKGMLDYPEIKNTVLYYFRISAYDSYKTGTVFNHESAMSKEVSARPFAGSEI